MIHFLHPQAITFENLDPLLRVPIKLDFMSIQQKLVGGGRGGYCFEQNLLLQYVLKALGFKVKGLAARILWNVPENMISARGHMLLLVEVENKPFIADVGFGGITLTAPLLLEPDVIQETSHENYRIIRAGEVYVLEAIIRNEWKPLYSFDLQEQFLSDYEVSNWYLCNHPSSRFINCLVAARTIGNCRYALLNAELAVHQIDGGTERHLINSVSELRLILEDTFGLNLCELPGLDAALQKVI